MLKVSKILTAQGPDRNFTIDVTMGERWVPQFLAMLNYMQELGGIGSSRNVTLFADGDGDFRPKFSWDAALPSETEPAIEDDGDRTYDAG